MTDLSLRERLADALQRAEDAWLVQAGDASDGLQEAPQVGIYLAMVDALIAELTLPDNGLAIVPVEATEEMLFRGTFYAEGGVVVPSTWESMVKAAPPADLLRGKTNDQG